MENELRYGFVPAMLERVSEWSVLALKSAACPHFRSRRLGGQGCDAVCLQEVGPSMLVELEACAARQSPKWHVHACDFATTPGGGSGASATDKTCHAITCIVAARYVTITAMHLVVFPEDLVKKTDLYLFNCELPAPLDHFAACCQMWL